MSDERKCYAGDLGSDQIGHVVEVVLDDGGRMADELVSVQHDVDVDGKRRTLVRFKHIPDRLVTTLVGSTRAPWRLDVDSEVTVRP